MHIYTHTIFYFFTHTHPLSLCHRADILTHWDKKNFIYFPTFFKRSYFFASPIYHEEIHYVTHLEFLSRDMREIQLTSKKQSFSIINLFRVALHQLRVKHGSVHNLNLILFARICYIIELGYKDNGFDLITAMEYTIHGFDYLHQILVEPLPRTCGVFSFMPFKFNCLLS